MNKKFLSIVLGVIFTLMAMPSLADKVYVCSHADKQRTVTISYDVEGQSIPCEVHYEKDTGKKRLWRAEGQAGFCEEKTAEFIAKQEGWGWSCAKQETAIQPANAVEPKQAS